MEPDNQEETTLAQHPAMIIIKLERKETLQQSRREHHIVNGPCRELAYAQRACVFSVGKMADRCLAIKGGSAQSQQRNSSRENATNCLTFVAR